MSNDEIIKELTKIVQKHSTTLSDAIYHVIDSIPSSAFSDEVYRSTNMLVDAKYDFIMDLTKLLGELTTKNE